MNKATHGLHVELSHVSFGFDTKPGAAPMFSDLSLDVNPYTRAVLVGPNGAGKSTLLNLLVDGCSHRKAQWTLIHACG